MPKNHRLSERKLIAFVRDGTFEIDQDGRIWRVVERGRVVRRTAEKRLTSGYLMVRIMVDGKRIVGLSHRLVWQAHRGDIPEGKCINHKNGNKSDNRLNNLEVVTYSENIKHAHRMGFVDQTSTRNPAAKLTDEQVREIRRRRCDGERLAALAVEFGISFQYVSRLARGDSRTIVRGAPISREDGRRNFRMPRDERGRFVGNNAASRTWDEVPTTGAKP